jgi:hypothetical protein
MTRLAVLLFAMLGCAAHAAEDAWVSPTELRALITDNTITGRYNNGEPYSEYRAPDGRVLGHNNRVPNEEACWDIKADQVCYYYAKGRSRGEFCWRLQKLGEFGIRARLTDRSNREIIGVLRKGNPNDHADNGKPWTCDPVTSERMTPHEPAARYARR